MGDATSDPATTETWLMFLALLTGLLVCCPAAAETPTPPEQDSTIYRSGKRTTEMKASSPNRWDIYDTHGNRIGYGQRSPINGDIDFYDTHGKRLAPVVKPSGSGQKW